VGVDRPSRVDQLVGQAECRVAPDALSRRPGISSGGSAAEIAADDPRAFDKRAQLRPGRLIYVYYIYEQAFQYFMLGEASAAVVLFFVVIVGLTLGQWLAFRPRVHYTT